MARKAGVGLFVSRLHWTVSSGCLRKYFEKFGNVLFAQVHIEQKTGLQKGYGWVRMSSDEEVLDILDYKRHIIEGYDTNVRRDQRDAPQVDDLSTDLSQKDLTDRDSPLPSSVHMNTTGQLTSHSS